MKKYSLSLLGAVILAIGLVSFSQPDTPTAWQVAWGKVGESEVEPTDNGMKAVNTTGFKPLKAIKLKVTRGGVNLHRCEIWFADGSKKSVELRNEVPAGNESREINLTDNNEQVSKIVFWYDTRNYGKQKSMVELWGKQFSNEAIGE